MRNFLLIILISSCSLLYNCKKVEPQPKSEPEKATGDLRVTVRLYSAAGHPGSSAKVNVALSADSLSTGKYILTKDTDEYGYALFKEISWQKNTKRTLFVNAEQANGANTLKGKNSATLTEGRVTNVTIVIE